MKKILLCCLIIFSLTLNCYASSRCGRGHCHHSHHNHSYHSSSGSNPIYIIGQDYKKTEQRFPNCNEHYIEVETYTYRYSDGSRRVYNNCTVYNADGTVIAADCISAKHLIYEKKHFFIIYKNGYYLIDSEGNRLTNNSYSKMDEFKPNRLIVRRNKKYGIIDLKENVIVPIKYQKFIVDGNGVFITKLNGYWGIVDSDNRILVENDCEKIKSLQSTILLKRYNKYGLTDLNGKIIYDIKYDKIKNLGEYILVREGKKYFILDSDGERINDFSYKRIKLERNSLYGLGDDKKWIKINVK